MKESNINQTDLDKIIYCLQNKEVLLILDNIEDPLQTDEKNFKQILQQITDKCQQLKILSTSRTMLRQIGNITEAYKVLQYLN